jgi:hypothetical protein
MSVRIGSRAFVDPTIKDRIHSMGTHVRLEDRRRVHEE